MRIKGICDRCEHDIDFHRMLKSAKPKECLAVFKDEDGENYCKCNEYTEEWRKRKNDTN